MKEQKIVITTDGKTTLARLYEDNKVVKRAEAKCCPSDTFNFQTGAELAMSRVFEPEKEDIFPLADIKAGYLLVVEKNGRERFNMTVVPSDLVNGLACCNPGSDWWPLDCVDDRLEYRGFDYMKIVEVWGTTSPMRLLDNTTEERERLWVREPKPKPKKRRGFKVGDKVRVTGRTRIWHSLKIGSVGTVTKIADDDSCTVKGQRDTGGTTEQWVKNCDLELIQVKF